VVWLIAAVSSWFNAVDENFSFSLRTLKTEQPEDCLVCFCQARWRIGALK
jgi:hypothetical protein